MVWEERGHGVGGEGHGMGGMGCGRRGDGVWEERGHVVGGQVVWEGYGARITKRVSLILVAIWGGIYLLLMMK